MALKAAAELLKRRSEETTKMNYQNNMEGICDVKAAGSNSKNFVLWREVVTAYAAPAIMAGIGGLITADKGLQIGALTTIGGSSALVAWMIGLWLRSRGGHKQWITSAPRLIVVGMFALTGALFGLFAAWVTSGLLEIFNPSNHLAWFSRVWTDFPLSATIASTTVTWRWRLTVTKNFSATGGDRK
ncbi:hypothetical protein DFP93_12028 [Aneurinibacillus soli]|uniref:Uncharacterized protein n=1 Tax=Aneurinibacillus soli TaxID=1500254 RepID=A0A0U5AVT3_9BACL|nr:hypothetical protein DFP93_12028 [Aneurinibacillus soli]BAU26048.1 hypothetical protein CB4_00120 [Aneurinibacillus soli]